MKTLRSFDACYGSVPKSHSTPLPSPSLFCWRAVKAAVSAECIARPGKAEPKPGTRTGGAFGAGTDQHTQSSSNRSAGRYSKIGDSQ